MTPAAALLLCVLSGSSPASIAGIIDTSENLWMAQKFTDSNRVLATIWETEPDNPEAYWRTCRNFYDIAENLPSTAKDERYALYVSTETYGRTCMKANPTHGDCIFWTGVGMGRQGTVRGILTQLKNAKTIRTLWEKALRHARPYRSKDGTANTPGDYYLALAMYYRMVPDWWIVQVLLGTRGDIDKSVDMMKKAVDIEPGRMEYIKEYGISLLCRGMKKNRKQDIEEGRKYLEKVSTIPLRKDYDKSDIAHSRYLLANPSAACGYSRDGQQDFSYEDAEKAFNKNNGR